MDKYVLINTPLHLSTCIEPDSPMYTEENSMALIVNECEEVYGCLFSIIPKDEYLGKSVVIKLKGYTIYKGPFKIIWVKIQNRTNVNTFKKFLSIELL